VHVNLIFSRAELPASLYLCRGGGKCQHLDPSFFWNGIHSMKMFCLGRDYCCPL
jgi:hypothetical protein